MYYVYVLLSLKDDKLYSGFTDDLKRRIEEHNRKEKPSTKSRVPFRLVYYEGCIAKGDAKAREKYLKSTRGKKYLKFRIKRYLGSLG